MARCISFASMDDIRYLLRYIQPFVNHGNQYYRDGKLVISTFGGDWSKFGHDTFDRGWVDVKGRLEEITPVSAFCHQLHAVVNPESIRSSLFHLSLQILKNTLRSHSWMGISMYFHHFYILSQSPPKCCDFSVEWCLADSFDQ